MGRERRKQMSKWGPHLIPLVATSNISSPQHREITGQDRYAISFSFIVTYSTFLASWSWDWYKGTVANGLWGGNGLWGWEVNRDSMKYLQPPGVKEVCLGKERLSAECQQSVCWVGNQGAEGSILAHTPTELSACSPQHDSTFKNIRT